MKLVKLKSIQKPRAGFTDLVGQVVWDKYKEVASKNKYKKARDSEVKILKKKIDKFNTKMNVNTLQIQKIDKENKKSSSLSGGIFNGKYNEMFLEQIESTEPSLNI